MATIENTYTGNGSTTNYTFTFEYLEQADVKVTLDSVATSAYTFANATTISFNTAPGSGVAIRIYRDTDVDALKATFFPGSAIKAEDLNNNFTQNNFSAQESKSLASQAPTALANSQTAINTANAASADASAALSAVNQVVSAQTVATVAALAVLDTSGLSAQDLAAVFNSTNIETYNTTYPAAPQITGVPVGFVGASDVIVRLVWNGTGWTWNGYFSTDPDNRYLTTTDAASTYIPLTAIGTTVQGYDADTVKTDVLPTFTVATRTTERTITAGSFDLSTGNLWTVGAITVPNPTNAAAGQTGAIRITAGPVVWSANFKFPGGTAPTITTFPAIIPYYVQDSSTILMGNVTEGIA